MDEPIFIIIDSGEQPQYVTLASQDEPTTTAGREYVSTTLCLMYSNGETLEN
jgi:hypothetical protein